MKNGQFIILMIDVLKGSLQEPYIEYFSEYTYYKQIHRPVSNEITHLLVNPPNEYPRILIGPRLLHSSKIRLVDYEITFKKDKEMFYVYNYYLHIIPNYYTLAKNTKLLQEGKIYITEQCDFKKIENEILSSFIRSLNVKR